MALGFLPRKAAPFVTFITVHSPTTHSASDDIRMDGRSLMLIGSTLAAMDRRAHFVFLAHLELRFLPTKCAPGRPVC